MLPRSLPTGGLAVGDEVEVAPYGTDRAVVRVLPRRSVLKRGDQTVAANVDLVVLVAALLDPPLRPRLIDRYAIAVRRAGAELALALNKIDLAGAAERAEAEERLRPYTGRIPIVPVSAQNGEGLEALRGLLVGKTVVFVGHSGVGKSSLTNALFGEEVAATKTVGERLKRGRHTTTGSRMRLLDGGTRLIDSPGIRMFALDGADVEDLFEEFPEVAETARACRFRDCQHRQEPGCAVRARAEADAAFAERFDTFRRLRETL